MTIDKEDIQDLRDAAGSHGDLEQVAVCDRALAGNPEAVAECERIIRDFQEEEEEEGIVEAPYGLSFTDIIEPGTEVRVQADGYSWTGTYQGWIGEGVVVDGQQLSPGERIVGRAP